jgi:hypothetical protein
MGTLEKRISKLEKTAPHWPCPNPQHQGPFVWTYADGDAEEAGLELQRSIGECLYCRDKRRVAIVFEQYNQTAALQSMKEPAAKSQIVFQKYGELPNDGVITIGDNDDGWED